MTPEQALQHEWIKEGLVHKRRESNHRIQQKIGLSMASPAVSDSTNTSDVYKPDPYKVPAQPPVKVKAGMLFIANGMN